MSGLRHLALLVRLLIEDRQQLALENVALRHQLAVLKRSVKRASRVEAPLQQAGDENSSRNVQNVGAGSSGEQM